MTRDGLGPHRRLSTDPRGRDRRVEDVSDMLIFYRWIRGPGAVAVARDDNRDFASEIDKAFEDPDLASHAPPSLLRFGSWGNRDLPLAVIAHARGLEHSRVAEIAHRPDQRCLI